MRNEFYADERDTLKWTVCLDAAGATKSIIQVAMLVPDRHQGQGQVYTIHPAARPDVNRFFAGERAAFAAGAQKDVFRIAGLTQITGVAIDVIAYYYNNMGHRTLQYSDARNYNYFTTVVGFLDGRPEGRLDVVLLDPDTGIVWNNPSDEHVRPADIARVWEAMREGDILLVFQFNNHQPDWVNVQRDKLAAAIGVNAANIQDLNYGHLCFYQITK